MQNIIHQSPLDYSKYILFFVVSVPGYNWALSGVCFCFLIHNTVNIFSNIWLPPVDKVKLAHLHLVQKALLNLLQ